MSNVFSSCLAQRTKNNPQWFCLRLFTLFSYLSRLLTLTLSFVPISGLSLFTIFAAPIVPPSPGLHTPLPNRSQATVANSEHSSYIGLSGLKLLSPQGVWLSTGGGGIPRAALTGNCLLSLSSLFDTDFLPSLFPVPPQPHFLSPHS